MPRSSTLHRPRRRVACQPRVDPLEGRQLLSAGFDSAFGVGSTTGCMSPHSIAVDSAGNSYVTGMFMGTVDFDPTKTNSSAILTSSGSDDIFVAKYSASNTLDWVHQMGSNYVFSTSQPTYTWQLESGHAIAVDASGNVYVTGDFGGKASFGPFTLNSVGNTDVFVTKLGPDGTFLWAQSWGTAGMDIGSGIAVDGAGNVISVGIPGTTTGLYTGFEINKYSPSGVLQWTDNISDTQGRTSSVATDTAGNIYLCGGFEGRVNFNPAPHKTDDVTGSAGSAYVLKLTPSGAFGWVSPFLAETAQSPGAYVNPYSLTVDAAGNIDVGGVYKGKDDFNPSSSVTETLPNIGEDYDGFVAQLSSAGALNWATPLGGAVLSSVATDANGNVYATGTFDNSSPFTPGNGLPAVTCNGVGNGFVAGLSGSTGAVSWAETFGELGNTSAMAIAVYSSGTTLYIDVVGIFLGTANFDPAGTYDLTNPATGYDQEMFVLELG